MAVGARPFATQISVVSDVLQGLGRAGYIGYHGPMILHSHLPYDHHAARNLPGVQPLDPAEWILADEAYAGQMAERARLLANQRDAVCWLDPVAQDAADELLNMVLNALPQGFVRHDGDRVTRPDGVQITLNRADPMGSLGHLVQQDMCLLIKEGAEHVLRAGLLCFPASWRLDEKAGRPLTAIHEPVQDYDNMMARRVQRLFDGVKDGRPLWRCNALWYEDPALFQPRSATVPRPHRGPDAAPYLRSERQCILRLPQTDAVVFSIHTYVLPRQAVEGAHWPVTAAGFES